MSEKPKRQPPPQIEVRREDANSRTTLDVDPTWLEANRQSLSGERASLDRRTMDVEAEWLERDSNETLPRSAVPPPLPVAPRVDEEELENEPIRSAIPPPLPPQK